MRLKITTVAKGTPYLILMPSHVQPVNLLLSLAAFSDFVGYKWFWKRLLSFYKTWHYGYYACLNLDPH